MKATMKLRWNGKAVSQAVKKSAVDSMNETLQACVVAARGFVAVDTGTLRSDIMYKPAVIRGFMIEATWGAPTVAYAIWQEIGTSKMPAHPYLRPAADREYPQLAARMRRRLQGG